MNQTPRHGGADPDERRRRWEKARSAVGSANSGPGDVSEKHDEYLAEALYEDYLEGLEDLKGPADP